MVIEVIRGENVAALLHVISMEVHVKLIKVVPIMLKCNATQRNCNEDLLVLACVETGYRFDFHLP